MLDHIYFHNGETHLCGLRYVQLIPRVWILQINVMNQNYDTNIERGRVAMQNVNDGYLKNDIWFM